MNVENAEIRWSANNIIDAHTVTANTVCPIKVGNVLKKYKSSVLGWNEHASLC